METKNKMSSLWNYICFYFWSNAELLGTLKAVFIYNELQYCYHHNIIYLPETQISNLISEN